MYGLNKHILQNKVPLKDKLEQLLEWIDMPLETRPQLILGRLLLTLSMFYNSRLFLVAYEPSLDQAGHAYGPGSKEVNDSLVYIDTFARDLHKALADRNLLETIDIIFVSDHGMTDTRHVEFIYLENLIGQDLVDSIEHEDGKSIFFDFCSPIFETCVYSGWPAMGLRFHNDTDAKRSLELLKAAAANMSDKFAIYTRETMPESYHFSNNPRIAPLYIIPNIGYAVTTEKEGKSRMTKGVSFSPFYLSKFVDFQARITDILIPNPRCLPLSYQTGLFRPPLSFVKENL